MTTKQTYIARADGWIAGRRVKAGEEVPLTPAEAKYEPVDTPPETVSETSAKPARRRRGKSA